MSKYNKEHIDYYVFLEQLRLQDRNMFGAAPDLAAIFGISKLEARKICVEWMEHYETLIADGVFEDA